MKTPNKMINKSGNVTVEVVEKDGKFFALRTVNGNPDPLQGTYMSGGLKGYDTIRSLKTSCACWTLFKKFDQYK